VAPNSASIVITDTSILINLSHTRHLSFLGKIEGFEFVVPDEVVSEITQPDQKGIVEAALSEGILKRERITTPAELSLFADLLQILGSGESACLALAACRGWMVACDERRVFLREARNRLGERRILNTAGLYLLWIRAGILSVSDADQAKEILESRRFKFAFRSYGDLVK